MSMTEGGDPATDIRVIFGLGNPGLLYRATRHNAGFLFLDQLASSPELKLLSSSRERLVHTHLLQWQNRQLLLAKPQTYMNRSGLAFLELANRLELKPAQFLVVYDDLDLPLGTIRIRPRGSSGGHRGLQSIIEQASTTEIPRLRIGIRPDGEYGDAAGFVLAPFTAEEETLFQQTLAMAVEAFSLLLQDGLAAAMCRYNR